MGLDDGLLGIEVETKLGGMDGQGRVSVDMDVWMFKGRADVT